MEEFVLEIREDYQIPPYFSDASLRRIVDEGKAYFEMLNPGADFETDTTYRMLLKNYAYYSYHHRVDEFKTNYASLILTWQMESEVKTSENSTT